MAFPRPPARQFHGREAAQTETFPYAVLFGHGDSVVTVLVPEQGQAPQTLVYPCTGGQETHRQAEFDAFAKLYEQALASPEQFQVCISSTFLRTKATQILDKMERPPVIIVETSERSRILITRHTGSHSRPNVEIAKPQFGHLLIGSDASWGKDPGAGVGIACVTEDGRWAYKSIQTAPRYAEMAAIILAVSSFPGMHLTVCTDSLITVGTIANGGHSHHDQESVAHLLKESQRRDIEICWVAGHEGIPINEAAHRLALNAYRHGGLGVSQRTSDETAARIADEFASARSQVPTFDPRKRVLLRAGRVVLA